jgi:hypothetical protein
VGTRINCNIVPVTNFNKYLTYGTSESELYYINIGAKYSSEKIMHKLQKTLQLIDENTIKHKGENVTVYFTVGLFINNKREHCNI